MNKNTSMLLFRYATATASIALAILVRKLLDPVLGDEFPFATLFFAVTVSAWYGGFGPALLAVILGALFSAYFLIPPRGSFAVQGWDQQVGMAMYLSVSVGIALLGGSMRLAQHRAEANALAERRQREKLRVTLESIEDAVIVTDAGGRVRLLNPAAQGLTGWRAEDASGQPLEKVFHIVNEETGQAVESPVTRVLQEGVLAGLTNHMTLIASDGTQRPIEDSGAPIRDEAGAITGVVLVFRDVTERHRAEAAFRDSEARFRTLIEQSVVGFYVIQDDRYVYVNPKLTDILGYSAVEMASRPVLDFIAEEDRPLVADNIRKRLEGTVESIRYHLRMRHREGRIVHMEAHGTRAEYAGTLCILGIAVDVTDHIRAQETLERLAALVASSEDAITGITPAGVITDWNIGAERLFGYTAAEVVGQNIFLLIPPEDRAEADRTLERLRQGEAIQPYETVRRRKDGSTVVVSARLSPIQHQNRFVGFSLIYHDLTHTRKLEEQLRQAQKMEAIGQLAGGVAHDFNNLLTVISGYSEIVVASLPAGDRNRGLVQEIYKSGERAALLTRQLLAFSRKQVLEPKVLNLNAIVAETEKMLRRLIGEDVSLTAVLAPDLGAVKVDPGQVEQVVMNLAVNARDAMPQGGRITIETANVDLDERYAQAHVEVKPGRYAMLAVSDTGIGMDEATKARIFEPFFTTKGPGKGTGLGLATVYGIVKQSGGSIGVYSEPGKGTAFKVYLPVVEERIPSGNSHHGLKVALRGSETVLLVEDEPAVRSLSRLALQMYGYKVLEATQGEEALRVSEQHQGPIHLLLTDVVMPGMSGRQVADALRPRYPTLKVLFVSGYTDDAIVRHGVLEAETAFLQKPFTPVVLANKVREVLDH